MKKFALIFVLMAVGCVKEDSADNRQRKETENMVAEAHSQVGMPDITRWTERKLARDILELRDKEITTYVYIVNLHGELIYLGEAIGFGLPYSVQFTNPEKAVFKSSQGGFGSLPQPDPNGLFMPEGLAATWIMLKGPDGVHPVYVEPEIIVSPFKLHAKKVEENES